MAISENQTSKSGFFSAGDRIQLTDNKGRQYSFNITVGKEFHTHQGFIKHDDLIGMPEGSVVSINSTTGVVQKFMAFKPLLTDYVLTMPRSATIVYPKDSALIVGFADIFPGFEQAYSKNWSLFNTMYSIDT